MSIPVFTMTGNVALITGGRTGIGRAFALAFANAGADVAICSRTDEGGELEGVADQIRKIGQRALAVKADVSRRIDVENMVKKIVGEFGGIDILINNAGISPRCPLLETEEELWDKTIDINLKGCYLCSRAVGKIMVEQKRGNIINIASELVFRVEPNRAAYIASKAGIIMFTKVLAREWGRYNIRVNAIAPGLVNTRMSEYFFSDPDAVKAALPNYPLGRLGEPDDIVYSALFLASDGARFMTGHTIVVDGGSTA